MSEEPDPTCHPAVEGPTSVGVRPAAVRLSRRALDQFMEAHGCTEDRAVTELRRLLVLATERGFDPRRRRLPSGAHMLFYRGSHVVLSPDLSVATYYATRHHLLPSELHDRAASSWGAVEDIRRRDPGAVVVMTSARRKFAQAVGTHPRDPAIDVPLRSLLATSWTTGTWHESTDERSGERERDRYRIDFRNCRWFVSAFDGSVIGFRVEGELPTTGLERVQ